MTGALDYSTVFGAFTALGDGGVPALAGDPVVPLAANYFGYFVGVSLGWAATFCVVVFACGIPGFAAYWTGC